MHPYSSKSSHDFGARVSSQLGSVDKRHKRDRTTSSHLEHYEMQET